MRQSAGPSTTYHCLKCRLAQHAEVKSRRASTNSGTSSRNGFHRADANTRVAMLLALKRCPRCGYFDRGVAEHNRRTLRTADVAFGILLAITVLTLFAIPSVSRLAFSLAVSACVVAFVVLHWRLRTRFPQSVEGRVILTEHVPVHDGWWH